MYLVTRKMNSLSPNARCENVLPFHYNNFNCGFQPYTTFLDRSLVEITKNSG